MEKLNEFYIWFTGLGGEVKLLNVEAIISTVNEPQFLVSTLKNRASEIKEKYNHKFNFKNR